MKDLNDSIFCSLFKDACEKCFGFPLTSPLSETDSKVLSNKILEQTGLVIGVKSIKNYSIYVLNPGESKKENPSPATLDTFARYVLNAPYTDEATRKDNEAHYPYWFTYRSKFGNTTAERKRSKLKIPRIILVTAAGAMVVFILLKPFTNRKIVDDFIEKFNSVREDSLISNGWFVKHRDTTWWNKRNTKTGHLSLYTLHGDNWPGSNEPGGIRNLLVRSISAECFTTEIHISDFAPMQNWQQAGILLSEDSTFKNKVLRLSISYNDFFGGYKMTPEIILQGVSAVESGSQSKPEEFVHAVLFKVEPSQEELVKDNLKKSALKIEKKGNHFRFLYTAGSLESFAFREVIAKDFMIQPKYIALFAIEGFSDNKNFIPANFDSFSFNSIACDEH
jgi:hypothetical protein